MGQLVTDSRFLMASPYSSRVHSTGPEGLSLFFEEKPWTVHCQDSNVGQDAHGTRAPGYWPLAGPSLTTPHSKVPRGSCEPIDGPTFEPLGVNGLWERFQPHIPSYLQQFTAH
jgi:hypothetical protein